MAPHSVADIKTGTPEIWMVAFNDREAINALWKIPEDMDFVLLDCPVSPTRFSIQLTLNKPLMN